MILVNIFGCTFRNIFYVRVYESLFLTLHLFHHHGHGSFTSEQVN